MWVCSMRIRRYSSVNCSKGSEMSLYRELIVQREALDKQIESARAAEFDAVVSGIRQKMQTYGICLADLGRAGAKPRNGWRVRIAQIFSFKKRVCGPMAY